MTLVQSWIDSLTLLKPKNAQLFIMVTIKSIIEAYKVMFWYLWAAMSLVMFFHGLCLLILPILFDTYIIKESATLGTYMEGQSPHWIGDLFEASMHWINQWTLFTACLATRPSIMKKDWIYFKSHMYSFIYIAIVLFLIPKVYWPTAFSPFYIFLVLFFLDSAQGPKDFLLSMWSSLKMIVFNYPLLVVIGICWGLLVGLSKFFIVTFIFANDTVGLRFFLCDIYGVCLLPIGVCFYANIYIKKLHDQFDLYFQSP